MFCQNCGAFDTDDAKFCNRCGESLSELPGRKKSPHLRIWDREAFRGGSEFFRFLFDSHLPASKTIRLLRRLIILSVALFSVLLIATSSGASLRFGLITLLTIATLAFLFMGMCGGILRELDSAISRVKNPQPSRAEKPEEQDPQDLKDQIEWNIE